MKANILYLVKELGLLLFGLLLMLTFLVYGLIVAPIENWEYEQDRKRYKAMADEDH